MFALTVPDAQAAFDVIRDFDRRDPFSRAVPLAPLDKTIRGFRFGVPRPQHLDFFGDAGAAKLFDHAVRRLEDLGGIRVDVDFAPFLEINDMLFRGPWLAERYGALKEFLDSRDSSVLPVTRDILLGGARITGADVFAGQQRLKLLKREINDLWRDIDVLVVPTTGTIYKNSELEADPVNLNTRTGTYTTFVNLADLSAVAVPSGFLPNGLPQGVTVIGPAFADNSRMARRQISSQQRAASRRAGCQISRQISKLRNTNGVGDVKNAMNRWTARFVKPGAMLLAALAGAFSASAQAQDITIGEGLAVSWGQFFVADQSKGWEKQGLAPKVTTFPVAGLSWTHWLGVVW